MATLDGMDRVFGNLDNRVERYVAGAEQAMEQLVAALEGWAKSEHSYQDRTSNNTNSIRGFVSEASPKLVRGVLSAGMSYSVFLELARDGKWAFLLPVVIRHRAEIVDIVKFTLQKG